MYKVELIIEVILHEVGLDELERRVACGRLCLLDHRLIPVDSRHSNAEPISQALGETAITTSHVQCILAAGWDLTQKQVGIVLVVVILKHDAFPYIDFRLYSPQPFNHRAILPPLQQIMIFNNQDQ